jgi:hypothetical protein
VDVGEANGWSVWSLESGDWAWSAWVASAPRRSGIEATEFEAESAAQRELELIVSEARAAAQPRRELSEQDDRDERWQPLL